MVGNRAPPGVMLACGTLRCAYPAGNTREASWLAVEYVLAAATPFLIALGVQLRAGRNGAGSGELGGLKSVDHANGRLPSSSSRCATPGLRYRTRATKV